MHLFIIGAPASGKMTIGQELSRLTDATLFYNHQAIDFALEIYQDYTEEMWEFVRGITFFFPWSKCKKSAICDFNRRD